MLTTCFTMSYIPVRLEITNFYTYLASTTTSPPELEQVHFSLHRRCTCIQGAEYSTFAISNNVVLYWLCNPPSEHVEITLQTYMDGTNAVCHCIRNWDLELLRVQRPRVGSLGIQELVLLFIVLYLCLASTDQWLSTPSTPCSLTSGQH